jgi:ribosomal protein S18 acetylase RimI-like enzyme
MVYDRSRLAGYASVKPDPDKGSVFLSKLYVHKAHRGRGISRQLIRMISEHFKKDGYHSIWLTVNKHNTGSIAAYRKIGFITEEDLVPILAMGMSWTITK